MGELLKISDRLGGSTLAFRAQSGSLEAWRFGGLEEPQRLRSGLSPAATMKPDAARLLRSPRRTTKGHKDCQRGGTADYGEHRGTQRRQRGTEAGGVLAHAGLPVCFTTKCTKSHNVHKGGRRRGRAWRGMAGFARHALGEGWLRHPGEQRTERADRRAHLSWLWKALVAMSKIAGWRRRLPGF